jgi:hypothetical protein
MMTPWDWQKFGYKTIFRNRCIYLFRTNLEVGYFTEAQGDRWMQYDNPNCSPWQFISYRQHPQLYEEFRGVAAKCYCQEGFLCSYCAGPSSLAVAK